jgi:hypothetical protein
LPDRASSDLPGVSANAHAIDIVIWSTSSFGPHRHFGQQLHLIDNVIVGPECVHWTAFARQI